MLRQPNGFVLVVLMLLVLVISCTAPTPTATPMPTHSSRLLNTPFVANTPIPPPATRPPLATATSEAVAIRLNTVQVDMDAIAPPGRARDLVMMMCSNCHSPFCAFRHQRTIEHWELVRRNHAYQGWGSQPAYENELIYMYLEENFNDSKPEPPLPDALSDQQAAGCTTRGF